MKKDCTSCTWAKWQTSAAGKRKLESPAECTVPVTLPHCFADIWGKPHTRNYVNKWTKPDCPLWAAKD